MTRFSTREARRCVWQTLRRHLLPLLLTLLLLSLPRLVGGWLEGQSNAGLLQARQEKATLQEMAMTPGWSDSQENQDLLFDAWMREAQLESDAELLDLIAHTLRLTGWFIALPLLPGVRRVLTRSLRGAAAGGHWWRKARISGSDFRRGLGLQCYILLCLALLELPGFLLDNFGEFVQGTPVASLVIQVLASLLTFALVSHAMLRYQLAPWLLAENVPGTAGELVLQSTDILGKGTLLPMLSILFPGLLMLAATWALHTFALQQLMPLPVAGLVRELLYLPAWAYLLTGSTAICVVFRKE